MSDYIMSFDESGQPYISHAFFRRQNQNGSKKDHKYYEKLKNGLKTRYFYSKQEWDAYQRNRSAGTRSVSENGSVHEGKGSDKFRRGAVTTPDGRPVGHSKKVTGEVKEGSVYKRGDGLNSSTPATGGTGFAPKNQKEREYAEAVEALADYKKKQVETKRARKAKKDNFKEYMKNVGLQALAMNVGAFEAVPPIKFNKANTKRDLNASSEAVKKAKREQREAAKTFLKETGDFVQIVLKEVTDEKKEQVSSFLKKYKNTLMKNLNK